jgi:chromosome segregation ATPase
MKRDFLKNLGIEDKEIIDKILDENSADIGRAKGELDTYKDKVKTLEDDIKTKEDTIKELNTKVGDTTSLNDKIRQLETDKTNLTNQLNTEVSKLQKTHAVESGVRDAKAKNVKAVMALLDLEKIEYKDSQLTGLTEQLDTLKADEGTSFLFSTEQTPPPSGTNPINPPPIGGSPAAPSFAEAVAKALGK